MRFLSKVLVNGADVCMEQIRTGLAWHYKQYAYKQPEELRLSYANAEVQEREGKVGLWDVPSQIPPWVFRHPERIRKEK